VSSCVILNFHFLLLPNLSLGYSQKGWTDNEIGIEYAKHFESQTRATAKGRWRVLYVDGHGSHVTRGFLQFCKNNKIHILCYPAHTTHIYQGLDVVIFSPMKQEFGRRRDKLFYEKGEAISKENFLQVYGETHLAVLTPELIKTAFRKTGIVPFDCSVITGDKLAPSRDTSFRYFTPVEPSHDVRIMTELMADVLQPVVNGGDARSRNRLSNPQCDNFPIRAALPEFSASETGYLASQSPIKSSSNPPNLPTIPISPIKRRVSPLFHDKEDSLLTMKVSTPLEKALQDALIAKDSEAKYYKSEAIKMQSAMVLQRLYCQRVRRQLGAKEEKTAKKKRKGGRINGDGLPRLLTSEMFLQVIEEHEAAEEEKQREKEARAELRAKHDEELAEWEEHEKGRRDRNTVLAEKYREAVETWQAERLEAKASKQRLKDWDKANPKPKKTDFVEKQQPKPTLRRHVEEGDGDEVDDDSWSDVDEDNAGNV